MEPGAVSSRQGRFAFEMEHEGECVQDGHEGEEVQTRVCTA